MGHATHKGMGGHSRIGGLAPLHLPTPGLSPGGWGDDCSTGSGPPPTCVLPSAHDPDA